MPSPTSPPPGGSRRAWPPRRILDVGGWELRFAGGYSGRANSVNPFGPAHGDLEANLRLAADFCRAATRGVEGRGAVMTAVSSAAALEDLVGSVARWHVGGVGVIA